MSTPKEEAIRIVDELPDDATWSDIAYHFYVAAKIHKSIEEFEAGHVIPHEEVERKYVRD